jgi:hypothetical protein
MSDPQTTMFQRSLPHLIAMCDGKEHCFFDHELAAYMSRNKWIYQTSGGSRITDLGRDAIVNPDENNIP